MFKELLNLNENTKFNNSNNKIINIFESLHIQYTEWCHLLCFIKNGYLPFRDDLNNLENINLMCHKLGGILSFDEYYKIQYNSIKNDNNYYNPQMPSEDNLNLYNWIIYDHTNIYNFKETFFDYDFAHTFRKGISQYTYCKKLKKN